jgi:hypothetical protein
LIGYALIGYALSVERDSYGISPESSWTPRGGCAHNQNQPPATVAAGDGPG